MQLLLKRDQRMGVSRRPTFALWARFELTSEETMLLQKYRVQDTVLQDGDPRRDLLYSIKYAALFGVLVAFLLTFIPKVTLFLAITFGIAAFLGSILVIYQSIREEIRVSDILHGRYFSCRSVVTLMETERTITEMAEKFRQFLEAMKNWGGTEIVPIEPKKEPHIRHLEPRSAAA